METQHRIQFLARYENGHGTILYPFTAYLRYMASAHAHNMATLHGWKLLSFGEFNRKGARK